MTQQERKKVSLLVVATNKYIQFLPGLLDSADKFFLKDCEVEFKIFSDRLTDIWAMLEAKPYKVKLFKIDHKPWPYATLKRFHFFRYHKKTLDGPDYFFYVDADALFVREVSDILSDRVAVQHCGYVGERGTYETRPQSTAYVTPHEGTTYFGGGFWGFSRDEFWKLVDKAVEMIDIDEAVDIVPVWHDESILNRYLIDNPPTKILDPAFHFPEATPHIYDKWRKAGVWFEPTILLLKKDHKAIR